MTAKPSLYRKSGNRHLAVIGDQRARVDSDLEERVLKYLEESGFAGRWRRLKRGISHRGYRYTPDFELAIERRDGTHRALVEIKPSVAHFKADGSLVKRMRGIAGHYGTDFFLLYVGDKKAWYQINVQNGVLEPFTDLIPGKLRIEQLHAPFHLPTWRVYDHYYSARPEFMKRLLKLFIAMLEHFLLALFQSPKKRKRNKRKK